MRGRGEDRRGVTAPFPRVVIVQRYVTHYRVPFFNLLRDDLALRGIELEVIQGRQVDDDGEKQHTVALPWARTVSNRWIGLGRRRLLWQPAMRHLKGADLVVVEQASARLLNYRLFLRQISGRTRLAFWGHGRNLNPDRASAVGELLKRAMSRRVHWWFAYNERSAEIVRQLGYPADRITAVQNAIDTVGLVRAKQAMTPLDVSRVRAQMDLPERHVGVYVGGMYPEKRLDFLLAASARVREALGDFVLVLIGAGADADLARRAAADNSWVHYLGPLLGIDTVPYVAIADVMLMPGLVGLAILDSFALETPIVTTADAPHSPEIDYLEEGRNGILLGAGTTVEQYAHEVVRLLSDPEALTGLRAGCREAAGRYTIEAMSARFADGIMAALEASPRR